MTGFLGFLIPPISRVLVIAISLLIPVTVAEEYEDVLTELVFTGMSTTLFQFFEPL